MPRIFEAPPGFVLHPDYLVPELRSQRDALLEALRALVHEGRENYVALDRGIGTETDAGKRWLNARAAIKAVEDGK